MIVDNNKIGSPNVRNTKMLTLRQLLTTASVLMPQYRYIFDKLLTEQRIVDLPFADFVLDSRQLLSGSAAKSAFVLLKSQTQPIEKSREYIKAAQKHAAFILSEIVTDELEISVDKDVDNVLLSPIVAVPNIRNILGTLIQLSLMPSAKLSSINTHHDLMQTLPKVVAITGTNGKTTISQLVAQLCQLSGQKGLEDSAVMGTAGNGRLNNLVQASHTTGDALAVQTFVRSMADDGVEVLALEASSHGLAQQRLQGVPIQVAIYTNLSRDHLDYHADMEEYAQAKARLFDKAYFPTLTHAIINLDDAFATLMLETAAASGLEVWTYSLDAAKSATFKAVQITPSLEGVEFELMTHFGTVWLTSPLLGRFNIANVLAAIAGVMALGIELQQIPVLVPHLQGAAGRMQRVKPANDSQNAGCFIVDYAHTPDALTQVLTSLKAHCNGQLWAVFGCGGDRDRGKRPLMAQAGLAIADHVMLTSDNPRSENPKQVLEDMMQGMSVEQQDKTRVIADRRQAITEVVKQVSINDIVVIAGKGHETYQEIKGVRHDFDDRQVLLEAFNDVES